MRRMDADAIPLHRNYAYAKYAAGAVALLLHPFAAAVCCEIAHTLEEVQWHPSAQHTDEVPLSADTRGEGATYSLVLTKHYLSIAAVASV